MALYHRIGLHAQVVPLENLNLISCNMARDQTGTPKICLAKWIIMAGSKRSQRPSPSC
jgi:hypothetical protein